MLKLLTSNIAYFATFIKRLLLFKSSLELYMRKKPENRDQKFANNFNLQLYKKKTQSTLSINDQWTKIVQKQISIENLPSSSMNLLQYQNCIVKGFAILWRFLALASLLVGVCSLIRSAASHH